MRSSRGRFAQLVAPRWSGAKTAGSGRWCRRGWVLALPRDRPARAMRSRSAWGKRSNLPRRRVLTPMSPNQPGTVRGGLVVIQRDLGTGRPHQGRGESARRERLCGRGAFRSPHWESGFRPSVGRALLGFADSDRRAAEQELLSSRCCARSSRRPTRRSSLDGRSRRLRAVRSTHLAERPERAENRIRCDRLLSFGGSYRLALAAADSTDSASAIPFYGSPELTGGRTRSAARYSPSAADQDERLMSSLPEVSGAMAEARRDFTRRLLCERQVTALLLQRHEPTGLRRGQRGRRPEADAGDARPEHAGDAPISAQSR